MQKTSKHQAMLNEYVVNFDLIVFYGEVIAPLILQGDPIGGL